MNIPFTRKKNSVRSLESELLNLLCKKFNFYAQLRMGQLKQTHLLGELRREVARKKFYLSKNILE